MCGLYSYVSKKNKWNELSRWKFQTLGVEMDSRGGDGCGIAFDNRVIKGATPKKFDDFWRGDNVPLELKDNAIIGHDRKASVGAQTFENTQPICFDNMDTILAHNGTIYNFKEMYASHKVKDHFDNDITGMSDSQVMCMLLEKSGWDVLNEYEGSMAFLLMKTDEPGIIYAYHGKSKYRKAAAVETEERPLYYGTEDGDTWMCSTKPALEKIIKNRNDIHELDFNKVFRFDGEEMTEVFAVNREDCTQWEDVTPVIGYNNDNNYNEYDYYYGRKERKAQQQALPFKSMIKMKISADKFHSILADSIYYEAGFFKMNEEKLNGLIRVTHGGVKTSAKDCINFYFSNGNLLKSQDAYIDLLHTIASEDYINSFPQRKQWIIGKYFANPFIVTLHCKDGDEDILYSCSAIAGNPLCTVRYTGTIAVPFSSKILNFTAGELTSITYGKFNGLDLLLPYHIQEPSEDLLDLSLMGDAISIAKEDKVYSCPFCLGFGSILTLRGEEIECEPCNGTGEISKSAIEAYIKEQEYEILQLAELSSSHEVEKARSMILHVIDRAVEMLDMAGFEETTELSDKLSDIKLSVWQK